MRILVNIALFLLPFAAFFLYARYANARRASAGHDPLETPWFWLAAAALSLAISGFFVLRLETDAHTGTYVPARVGPDGNLIPGHYEGDDDRPAHIEPPHHPEPTPTPTPVPTP